MNICEQFRTLLAAPKSRELLGELNEEKSCSWQFCANGPEADDGTFYTTCQRFMRVASPSPGYYMTEDGSESLEEMIEKAAVCGELVDNFDENAETLSLLAPEGEPWPAEMMEEPSLPAFDCAGMKALAGRLWRKIKEGAPAVTELSLGVSALARGRLVVNTLGLVRREMTLHYKVCAVLTAKGRTEMNNAVWRVYVPELCSLNEESFVDSAINAVMGSLDGGNIASGTYPVVISAPVMAQMLLGFWKIFSGEDILSHTSCLWKLMDSKIAGECFTLIDGREAPGTGLFAGFDDEGTLRDKTFVIDKGVFRTPLTLRESAKALGRTSSGNAGRKDTLGRLIPNALVTAPKLLYIEPSDCSLDNLLEGIEDGVYITAIDDIYHAFNFGSGNFSTPCRGIRIRNGKLAEGIRHVSLSDNLLNMFSGIEGIGNSLVFCDMEDLDVYYLGGADVRVRAMELLGDD